MRNVANDVKKTRQMYVGAILKEKSYKNARLRKIARNEENIRENSNSQERYVWEISVCMCVL